MKTIETDAVLATMTTYLVERAAIAPLSLAGGEATLGSLDVDSLSTVEMLWEVEDQYGVHIDDIEALRGMTLAELARFVCRSAAKV